MLRITNIEESLNFFCNGLGLKEARRMKFEDERFTLIFLSAPNDSDAELELTYNWDGDDLKTSSRNFGQSAERGKDIDETGKKVKNMGIVIN